MAVRSGAGTGVVVSLVVFVLTTVFLLILTIVFYAGREDLRTQKADAERALSRFITRDQRNQDLFRNYEAAAGDRNQSVAMHLHSRIESIMRYVDGDPGASLTNLQARMARFGVDDAGPLAAAFQDTHRRLQGEQETLASLQNQLERTETDLARLEEQTEQLRAAHRSEVESVQQQIAGYREASEDYRAELEQTRQTMDEAVDRLHDEYEGRIDALDGQVDDLNRERVQLLSRIEDLQQRLSADRIRAQDPSTLVDGRVIDVHGADQVFIDRGRNHRMVLGMTFEVYEDAAAIRVDQRTGELPRGKASIQVIRVGDNTSTAKIIRSVPGRPVVRDDVIANAVYDPEHEFKFLVHGQFDVDGDGRATDGGREYLERLVVEWGGTAVQGAELPGDLDFLVLGRRPEEPPPLRDGATEWEMRDWLRKRQAREEYDRLFRQARDAQIPVLNHNRFLILIGHTRR